MAFVVVVAEGIAFVAVGAAALVGFANSGGSPPAHTEDAEGGGRTAAFLIRSTDCGCGGRREDNDEAEERGECC